MNRLPGSRRRSSATGPHHRLPAVDLHSHRRCDLGAAGLGVLLELGPQGGLVLRHLGGLAAHLHARVTTGWRRQNAAIIALAGFACIVVNYGIVNVFFVGQHSYSGL